MFARKTFEYLDHAVLLLQLILIHSLHELNIIPYPLLSFLASHVGRGNCDKNALLLFVNVKVGAAASAEKQRTEKKGEGKARMAVRTIAAKGLGVAHQILPQSLPITSHHLGCFALTKPAGFGLDQLLIASGEGFSAVIPCPIRFFGCPENLSAPGPGGPVIDPPSRGTGGEQLRWADQG